MIDIQKQVSYWQNGALDDLVSAKILISNNRLLHGLFLCHLVVENQLKLLLSKQQMKLLHAHTICCF